MRCYSLLWIRLDRSDGFLIGYANGSNGVLLDQIGRVPLFPDQEQAHSYAAARGISLAADDPLDLCDLDQVQAWIDHAPVDPGDPTMLLLAWNLFRDTATAIGDADYLRLCHAAEPSYDSLCWESVRVALVPARYERDVELAAVDRAIARSAIERGLALFRDHLRIVRHGINVAGVGRSMGVDQVE